MSVKTSALVKEFSIFSLILGAALLVSALIGADPSLATSVISPNDNPAAVQGLTNNEGSIRDLSLTLLNFVLGFMGIVAVFMFVGAGLLYLTSAGNEDQVGKAKKIMLYSVVGILIIFISFALVNTLLGAAQGGGGVTTP